MTNPSTSLSVGRWLLPGVREQLKSISEFMKIHILTADTFGKARAELEGTACELFILEGEKHDVQKADIHVASAGIGLDLLLHPKRLKASLRF